MSDTWRLFSALGDPNRLEILKRLASGGPSAMARLVRDLPISRQAGAKHIAILAKAGLVTTSKRGREQVTALVPENLHLARMFMAQLENEWDSRLHRVRELAEA